MPRWVPKLLGLTGRRAILTTETIGSDVKVVRRQQRMKLSLRAVCRLCNNTWMSVLENRFKTLCGSAILGRAPMVLAPSEQRLVAAWATKTALLMELAYRFLGEHAYAPASNLTFLHARRGHRPPPADDTKVWIGAVGPGWRDVWHQASAYLPDQDQADPKDGPGWYLATIAVGHLLLHVFGRDLHPNVSVGVSAARPAPIWNLPVEWSRHLIPIWPVDGSYVSWPPELVVPEDDLLLLHPPMQ